MRWICLLLPRRLVVHWPFALLRSRKNGLIGALVLASFAAVLVVQNYRLEDRSRYLLEYDLSVSPTRPQPGVGVRTRASSDSGNKTTATIDVDGRIEFYEPSHCPKSISSLSKYSQWFRERFKPNIKLFLDKTDTDRLRNLSFYELPFGFKNVNHDFIKSLLHHNNFKNPPLTLRRDEQCISCAVVGSGGILNGSRAGMEIDAHDLVFRLNAAVTYGRHARDVGRRTDFYMFFPESAHLYGFMEKNVTLLYTMYKTFDLEYASEILNINRQRKSQKADPKRLKIIHPDFFRYIFAKFLDAKSRKPTTGAVVVMLAVHLCDSVTIYGFGYDPQFSMHYYDGAFVQRTFRSTWTHDVANERRLWDRLHHEGVLRFFRRDVV